MSLRIVNQVHKYILQESPSTVCPVFMRGTTEALNLCRSMLDDTIPVFISSTRLAFGFSLIRVESFLLFRSSMFILYYFVLRRMGRNIAPIFVAYCSYILKCSCYGGMRTRRHVDAKDQTLADVPGREISTKRKNTQCSVKYTPFRKTTKVCDSLPVRASFLHVTTEFGHKDGHPSWRRLVA